MHHWIYRILGNYKGYQKVMGKKGALRTAKKMCDEKRKSNNLCRNQHLVTLLLMPEAEASQQRKTAFVLKGSRRMPLLSRDPTESRWNEQTQKAGKN